MNEYFVIYNASKESIRKLPFALLGSRYPLVYDALIDDAEKVLALNIIYYTVQYSLFLFWNKRCCGVSVGFKNFEIQ